MMPFAPFQAASYILHPARYTHHAHRNAPAAWSCIIIHDIQSDASDDSDGNSEALGSAEASRDMAGDGELVAGRAVAADDKTCAWHHGAPQSAASLPGIPSASFQGPAENKEAGGDASIPIATNTVPKCAFLLGGGDLW